MTDQLEHRIKKLEDWRQQIDIERAGESVDRKHLDKRLDGIENAINGARATLTWLNRTIWGAVVLAIVGFALKGGFV